MPKFGIRLENYDLDDPDVQKAIAQVGQAIGGEPTVENGIAYIAFDAPTEAAAVQLQKKACKAAKARVRSASKRRKR